MIVVIVIIAELRQLSCRYSCLERPHESFGLGTAPCIVPAVKVYTHTLNQASFHYCHRAWGRSHVLAQE